jgi:NAD(P)-dependent dehydrogenase (short-subunit alcohol dehydrogenase family)
MSAVVADRGEAALAGRSVVISGAAGGIGSALARRFGRAGARVGLLDLEGAGLAALAGELEADGVEALALRCDVTSFEDCRAAVEELVAAWGGVDVLVANAGITHLSLFRDTDVEVIRRVMEVNFFGAVNCTKAALDSLRERRGHIVAMSSVAGFAPLATRCGYSASKHAMHGFFDSLRGELRSDGVGVTLFCPFFVRTEIGQSALGGDGGAPRMPRTETGTPADPEEVAEAVLRAVLQGRRLVAFPGAARLAYLLSRFLPGLYERIMVRRIVPGSGS